MQEQLDKIEKSLLDSIQVDCPLTHLFAPGVYWRQIEMPAKTIVLGHEHKTEHFNVILKGKVRVIIDGELKQLCAPSVFVSKPGIRKLLYIEEDCIWATVHPTNETDIEKLEELMVTKSKTFLNYQNELAIFKEILESNITDL